MENFDNHMKMSNVTQEIKFVVEQLGEVISKRPLTLLKWNWPKKLLKSPKHEYKSCNEMWREELPDMSKTTHFPFGSRVNGHIPLAQQTKIGGRGF